ncbi:SAM-dependent methyltransferase [marine bacterium AO1-C]|nr:SAM-dependent methyltransferase [marine bacterium AO1-C]
MLKAYLLHLMKAKTAYSLHSPFVFDLYTRCINHSKSFEAFHSIEKLRSSLLHNPQLIEVTDLGAGSRKNKQDFRKVNAIARHSMSSRKVSELLFRLVDYFQPQHILELGTSLGINTLYLAKAQPSAQVTTMEGCPNIASIARKNFKSQQVESIQLMEGNIDKTLPYFLDNASKLDFVFLDANHREAPTIRYFEQCLAKSHEDSVFILDDIYWSQGMQRAWEQIQKHPQVMLTIDLFRVGLVFFRNKQPKQHFKLRF